MIIANTLAKSGYFGGNPETVLNAPVDIVLNAFQYEIFSRDYENAIIELNKEGK